MNRIVVECGNGTSKVALLEGGRLAEFYTEGPEVSARAGNIYKGRVVNVLPGMEAAFVDIGAGRNAFLYRDDLMPANLEKQPEQKPGIRDLVSIGETMLVQIKKEPGGSKGARVTTHFTIPGRWIVLMPGADYTAVSRKIGSAEERHRLKAIGDELRTPKDGIILRTAAEGQTLEQLRRDWELVCQVWSSVRAKAQDLASPGLVYRDLELVPRLVRDLFTDRIDEMVVDDETLGRSISELVAQMSPELADRVKIHRGDRPLFQTYPVDNQLERAYSRRVALPSGGHIVVDFTEAMTVIDVNSGSNTSGGSLEETVFSTNMEAAVEIVRLLRLRDIGGMILVDFIDMMLEEHRQMVRKRMEDAAGPDRTKTLFVGWTKLGLFEITRRKRRQSHERWQYGVCSSCGGTGRTKDSIASDRRLW